MSMLRRLLNVFRQKQLDDEFEEELRFHREMSERHSREPGLSAPAAEAEAKRRLGNLTMTKDEMREARTAQWLASCIQDLRHGCALMRRDWVLSVLIVTVLALGIGGNAAIFSLFKAAFLDPLPYRDADRLVTILGRLAVQISILPFPSLSRFANKRSALNKCRLCNYRISRLPEETNRFAYWEHV